MSISFDEIYSAPQETPPPHPTAPLWMEDSASDFAQPQHKAPSNASLWEKFPEWLNLNPVR
ncbi:MAG: hypothetical protein OHK0052_10620 [Anaerolineales bacterium]